MFIKTTHIITWYFHDENNIADYIKPYGKQLNIPVPGG